MILPVITLYQPWATWIVKGWKLIETRTHNRFACLNSKKILIHAGQTIDGSDLTIKNPYLTGAQIMGSMKELTTGHILGSANVYTTMALSEKHSKAALIDCGNVQRYGLFLENIHEFGVPIPVKGEMGIWYFDLETMQKVKKPKVEVSFDLFNQGADR